MGILDLVKPDEIDAMVPRWREAGLSSSLIATLELGKRISRLNMLFEQAIKNDLAELGLTYAEFDVLAALLRAPSRRMRPSELAKSLFLTSGGISNVLQRLSTAGYVEREADEETRAAAGYGSPARGGAWRRPRWRPPPAPITTSAPASPRRSSGRRRTTCARS
ncbi:MarR family winged helix-turn-helix transcriptional regulator [Nonomuraea thailandensis]